MSAKVTYVTIITLLLTGTCFGAVFDPPLEAWMRPAESGDRVAVWVFFKDKGAHQMEGLEARIGEAAAEFTPAAVRRRLAARPSRPFDEKDLPLHRPYVKTLEQDGVEFRAFSRWLNAVSLMVDRTQLGRLKTHPFVESIRRVSGSAEGPMPDTEPAARTFAPLGFYGESYRQLEQIQAIDLHAEGYTGDGVIVAIFDTGFWRTHEALTGVNVIAEWDFINDDGVTENEPGDLSYQHNHGTSCLSLLAGYTPNVLIGCAYDAQYLIAKTEDVSQEEPIEEDWWIEAAEWADSLGAQIISSSLCYNDWYTYEDMDGETAPITICADQAAANGIVVVNAAGNSGASDWKYILAPADGDSVITAGAVDSLGYRAYFSSQGPTYDGRIKPTIMAQGYATYVADPYGETDYLRGSGTSFACPLIAGALALVLEKNPTWTAREVLDAIKATGTLAASPDTLSGWGILQARDASDYVPLSGLTADVQVLPGLRVYPNPARTSLHIALVGSGTGVPVSFYDISGRLIGRRMVVPGGAADLDLGSLLGSAAPGVVIVEAPGHQPAKVLYLKP
jgi:subtilisin family serine protease